MLSKLTAVFSPRKTTSHREVASSPLANHSLALSSRKLAQKSLTAQTTRRSIIFDDFGDDAPSTPSKRADVRTRAITRRISAAELSRDEDVEHDALDSEIRLTEAPMDEMEADPDEDMYTFEKFTDHRWVENSVEIQVEWEGGALTWEPEATLHEDARDALLAYWARQGGRPPNPDDPDLFDVHAIRKHSRDRKKLLVEWVGYGPEEASWVPRALVEETASEMVAAYWRRHRGAGRRGRPAKRRRK